MKTFLQWLGGADPEVLERTPSAGKTVAALGGTVLTTGIMAMAAFAMAIHDWLHLSTAVAAVIGVAWGVSIMNLDRWLLLASRRQAHAWQTVALAVPRVMLAFAIGFVIAEPLVMRVFHDDVTRQTQSDRQEERAQRLQDLDREYRDIPSLETREAKLESEITAPPTPVLAGNADYDAAKADDDRAQQQLAGAEKAVGCEAEGTCGTGRAGCGPVCIQNQRIAVQRRAAAARTERALARVTRRLAEASASSGRQAKVFASGELARVQKQLGQRRSERDRQRAQIERDFTEPIGLIDRETALSHLSSRDAVVGGTVWLFRLFLLAVDITPILFKTLLLLGAESPYERTQKQVEDHEQLRLKIEEEAEDEAQRVATALIVDEAKIQADVRHEALQEMHEEIGKVEKEVWREEVEDWKTRVRAARAAAASGGPGAVGGPPNASRATSRFRRPGRGPAPAPPRNSTTAP